MPRPSRLCLPGLPHHVTHRGNNKQRIFFRDVDRRVYLKMLSDTTPGVLDILAYCLMVNHVHLICVPAFEDSLHAVIQRVHGGYSRYFNSSYLKSGHLWGGRFKSSVLSPSHLWNAVAYVERNPVRARMVPSAEQYRWSSAAAHCGLRKDALVSGELPFSDMIKDWRAWLAREEPEDYLRLIRQRTRTGQPCGDAAFVTEVERRIRERGASRNARPDGFEEGKE